MKNIQEKFKGLSVGRRAKDQYGKKHFSKMVNKGMMKRWGKNKNMGRGKT